MASIITPTVEAPAPLDPDRKNPELTDAARDGGPVPYIQRKIDVTFSLGTGQFGEDGSERRHAARSPLLRHGLQGCHSGARDGVGAYLGHEFFPDAATVGLWQ